MSKKSLYTAAAFSFMSLCWNEASLAEDLDCTAITNRCIAEVNSGDSKRILNACDQFTKVKTGNSGMQAEEHAREHCYRQSHVAKLAADLAFEKGRTLKDPQRQQNLLTEMKVWGIYACKEGCYIKLQAGQWGDHCKKTRCPG